MESLPVENNWQGTTYARVDYQVIPTNPKIKLFKYACICHEQVGCIFSFSLIFYLPKLELCSNTNE